MLTYKKTSLLLLLALLSQPVFAQLDGAIKEKLTDLLYVFIPFAIIIIAFVLADKIKKKSD